MVTAFDGEEFGEIVEVGPSAVLPELLLQFFAIVGWAGCELLHFFESDDAIIVVVDDPEEGFGEVLIA